MQTFFDSLEAKNEDVLLQGICDLDADQLEDIQAMEPWTQWG